MEQSKTRRLHKSTMLIVFLLVLVPWILVAVPGDGGTYLKSARGIQLELFHGWPATHLVSKKFEPESNFPGKKFYVPEGSVPWDQIPLEQPESIFEHPLSPKKEYDSDFWAKSFWSDPCRWPSKYCHDLGAGKSAELRFKVVWLGLAVNLGLVLAVCFMLAWFCERRIRIRGSLFQFSISDGLVVVLLTCLLLSWIQVQNHLLARKRRIEEMKETYSLNCGLERSYEVVPRLVSRLFDYPDSLPLFLEGEKLQSFEGVEISIPVDSELRVNSELRQQFADDLTKIDCRKIIHLRWFDQLAEFLKLPFSESTKFVIVTASQDNYLPPIPPDADFSCVEPVADRTAFWIGKFDTQLMDRLPAAAKVVLWIENFSGQQPSNELLAEIVNNERPDVVMLSGVGDSGLEYLATLPTSKKIGVLRGLGGLNTSGVSRELLKRIDDAGYDTTDSLDGWIDDWNYGDD